MISAEEFIDSAEAARFFELIDKTDDLEQLVRLMNNVRQKLDLIKEIKARYEKMHDRLRLGRIPEIMDDRGINTVTYKDLGRVTLTSDLRATIPAANREEVYKWLEAEGYGEIIKETVNAGTLKSLCKKILKDGGTVPGIIKATPFSRASITKV